MPFESGDNQPFDEGNDKEGESPHTHPFRRQVMESLIRDAEFRNQIKTSVSDEIYTTSKSLILAEYFLSFNSIFVVPRLMTR